MDDDIVGDEDIATVVVVSVECWMDGNVATAGDVSISSSSRTVVEFHTMVILPPSIGLLLC